MHISSMIHPNSYLRDPSGRELSDQIRCSENSSWVDSLTLCVCFGTTFACNFSRSFLLCFDINFSGVADFGFNYSLMHHTLHVLCLAWLVCSMHVRSSPRIVDANPRLLLFIVVYSSLWDILMAMVFKIGLSPVRIVWGRIIRKGELSSGGHSIR